MRIDRRDLELLGVIADHRVMTLKQLAAAAAAAAERDPKAAHRRVVDLVGAGLIVQTDRKAEQAPPAWLLSTAAPALCPA